jgi:hypothetical protein
MLGKRQKFYLVHVHVVWRPVELGQQVRRRHNVNELHADGRQKGSEMLDNGEDFLLRLVLKGGHVLCHVPDESDIVLRADKMRQQLDSDLAQEIRPELT